MTERSRKVAIIGGGIAGLCAAVYARRCGYEVEVLEAGESAGGLATSWRRGDYTFETCLHWLLGSNPSGPMYARWQEVFDISKLTFVDAAEYQRIETEHGESLSIYTNVDRMETELLKQAPQDAGEIRRFAAAVRGFTTFTLPYPDEPWPLKWLAFLRALQHFWVLRHWASMTVEEYSARFTHPLLRSFFKGDVEGMCVLPLVLSMAWMSNRDAGYAIGGSQAIIRPIVDNLRNLGGRLRLEARVEKILVERDSAIGVQLVGGEVIAADWVISAADGRATIYDLLGGRYINKTIQDIYNTLKPFPSYVQVSLGVARDLSEQAGFVRRVLGSPLRLDPETEYSEISFRFFHFDPTFAVPGKTPVTCFLPTRNIEFWAGLERRDAAQYQEEKRRVAEAIIVILEKAIPGVRQSIEVVDVCTPASVVRFTGNWKGSMEGWLPTSMTSLRPLPTTLPGLRRFVMAGQWVQPGGGLPTGLMTARSAVKLMCRQDGVGFLRRRPTQEHRRAA